MAKAPRKNLAPAGGGVASPSSGNGKKKAKQGGAGNPLKMWPTPTWQKGLQGFFGGEGSSGECSSSSSSANTSLTETEQMEEQPEVTTYDRSELSRQEQGGSSGSGSSRVKLLDDDLTQLNSDSEED